MPSSDGVRDGARAGGRRLGVMLHLLDWSRLMLEAIHVRAKAARRAREAAAAAAEAPGQDEEREAGLFSPVAAGSGARADAASSKARGGCVCARARPCMPRGATVSTRAWQLREPIRTTRHSCGGRSSGRRHTSSTPCSSVRAAAAATCAACCAFGPFHTYSLLLSVSPLLVLLVSCWTRTGSTMLCCLGFCSSRAVTAQARSGCAVRTKRTRSGSCGWAASTTLRRC